MQAIAHISKEALGHNLSVVRMLAPQAKVLAMVKANAYGHGVQHCLEPFSEVDALGVAAIDEAQTLRQLGWKKAIVVMEGCFSVEEWRLAAQQQFWPVLHHHSQIEQLKTLNLESSITVWVEIDTGMHRLGFLCEELAGVQAELALMPQVQVACWFSHFSDADWLINPKTQAQIERFSALEPLAELPKSFANSAAIFSLPQTHHQWIRPGLMLYGVSPVWANKTTQELGLKSAMCLKARVIATRYVPASESVGYGSIWRAPSQGAWIATVSMGYGDGYPWREAVRSQVEIHGHLLPIVGRVSMDSLAVDISACQARVSVGDEVILWGSKSLPVEKVAEQLGVIPYVLLCSLTERVVRSSQSI